MAKVNLNVTVKYTVNLEVDMDMEQISCLSEYIGKTIDIFTPNSGEEYIAFWIADNVREDNSTEFEATIDDMIVDDKI